MNPVAKKRLLHDLASDEQTGTLIERIELELEFADVFVDAALANGELPDDACDRVRAGSTALDLFDTSKGHRAFRALVEETEEELADIGRAAKLYTMHCAGHGHIDMNWMWSWPETVSMTHDTFASALNFMDLYPDFHYSQSQASVYAATEKHHPEMFREIQKRVKEGRWEVTAPHWVEGDKNLASGEALCRHLLYTRAYFKDRFGLKPEDVPIDWEPDTFGHANTIPTILRQGGVKFYYSCRTGGGVDHPRTGESRPPLFYWQAPDGSRVLVNRETTWYNSYVNIGDNVALPLAAFVKETKLHHWLNVYGIGNHGGGPTRTEIEYLKRLDSFPIYPNIKFGTAKAYYEAVEQELADRSIQLPVLNHELNYEFTGCYTSQSLIKHANRYGENYCLEAETLAAITGRDERKALREAWIKVLFNHFHDILPGSGVRETREYARALFQEVGATTGAIRREALKTLASRVDTAALLPKTPESELELAEGPTVNNAFEAGTGMGAGVSGYSRASGGGKRFRPFLVYNPCPWKRTEPVKVAIYDSDFEPKNVVALDEHGHAHLTTYISSADEWGHKKLELMFHAHDVPGCGYRTFILCEGIADRKGAHVIPLKNEKFETPHLVCEFDRQSGGFKQLTLKEGDLEFCPFHGGFGTWRSVLEHDRYMSAWILGEEVERVALRSNGIRTYGFDTNIGTSLPEGPGSIGCHMESKLEVLGTKSSVELTALVHPLYPRIDFEATIDWREIGDKERGVPGLIVDFDTDSPVANTVYETPFGNVTRGPLRGYDVPSLRYCHVSLEDGGAFTLVQDCKYGFETFDTGLQMRVLRSSFNPDHAPEVAQTQLRYAVYLHNELLPVAELTRLGAAWNHPFIVAPMGIHNGTAPATLGFAESISSNIHLTSLRQAEHSDGLVVRLVEYAGRETKAVVELNPTLLEGRTKAQTVDLMERPVEGNAAIEGHRISVTVRPNSFATVLLS